MKHIARGILRMKWLVLLIFTLLLLVSFYCSGQVTVNYRLSDYLPDEVPSTVGLRIMEEEFDSNPSNLRILLEDVTVPEVLHYKEQIVRIPGIQDVTWLDDSVNVRQPLQMMKQDTLDSWYKDDCALITAYVSDENADAVIAALRELIGDRGRLSGDSVQMMETRISVKDDIRKIMMIAIPVIFIILLISTSSYFEPVLFLATIGVAIMIGKGTDLLLGQVSFITNACSAILQLAISMDYAIFLLEAFGENKRDGLTTFDAMTDAIVRASSSILSSSITTILGFMVMMLMQFKVGYDMGIVLAKDIAISLICVLVLLPVLALLCSNLIEKTQHRPLMPSFQRFARGMTKACIPLMAVIAFAVVLPGYLAQDHIDFLYGTTKMITDPAAQVVIDENRIDELFDQSNQMVLLVPGGNMARENLLVTELEAIDEVSSTISYSSMADPTIPLQYVGSDAVSALIGPNYDRIIITANMEIESERAYQLVEDIRQVAERYYPEDNYLTGGTANIYDMRDTVRKDDIIVNGFALLAIGIVLLINFKSIILPLILLITIKSSIWINVSVPYFANDTLYYISSLIINAIQLGATVDYAILFTDKYMNSRKTMLRKDAIASAISCSASAVITSASILFICGMTLGKLSSVALVGQLGILVGRGAAISCILVLTVLPALLSLFDPVIRITTVKHGFMTKKRLYAIERMDDSHEEEDDLLVPCAASAADERAGGDEG